MRVFVQRRLSEIIGPIWAIVVTGFGFGLILHLSNPLMSNLLYRVPAGLAVGYLFTSLPNRLGTCGRPLVV